jgi:hypothetical protein
MHSFIFSGRESTSQSCGALFGLCSLFVRLNLFDLPFDNAFDLSNHAINDRISSIAFTSLELTQMSLNGGKLAQGNMKRPLEQAVSSNKRSSQKTAKGSEPLEGVVACLTGLSVEKKAALHQIIQRLGGR